MKYYIGIDLGGTNIKAGVVNEEFEIIAKATCKTNLPRPAEEICEDMAKVALEAVKNAGLEIEQIESIQESSHFVGTLLFYSCFILFPSGGATGKEPENA